ncbi:hypothetical protein N9C35_00680 [Flavobacteriaceae bacterium]|nr:hypothetical protein [Flavobacteriaceae bacterium]
MKKGLLTVLLASLVLVGCQNYDDQFDDLNAQISALKSQVDGLSSLTGQVSSLSGSISGLSAGVAAAQAAATAAGTSADAATAAANGIDLTGLSASLATLQAEVDAVQASLATAATATAVAALQTELDAIEADVDELLATSNVYNQNLTISSASTLDAAFALGNNLNIVNGTVTISQSSAMDAAKLQTVIDKIFTVTGNYTYTAGAATVTAQTFDKLASTGDLTLTVNGPVSAKTLVTAGTVNLGTTFSSKVTSVNLDMLSTVTDIQTGGTSNTVNFASATDIQLGALAVYTTAMSITTKKGATLDIGSLDDLNSAGTSVDMGLTVNGPKDVTISGWDDSYTGTITATNVENLTISGYEGAIVIGDGTENVTVTGGVDVSLSSADDLETVDLTTKLFDDPNISATAKASVAYAAYGKENSLTFSSADLTSIKLQGYWLDVNSTDNSNLITVDIDATMRNLTLTNNDNLVTLDVTGSEIANVTMTNNDGIVSAVFDHTTELNYRGATADDKDVAVTITGNQGMTSLTWNASNVSTLAVNDNDKLATVDFTGLAAISTSATVSATVNVYDNNMTVATATDSSDGVSTQYAVDGATAGANNDALDLGSYATDGGMSTLKPYLLKVLADADAAGAVNFDTVTTHTIATGAGATGETEGAQNSGNASTFESNGGGTADPDSNWVGLIWGNVASDYVSTNPTSQSAQKEKRAYILDVSTLTGASTMSIVINSTQVLNNAGSYPAVATGITLGSVANLDVIIATLKSSAAVTRAADLGATLDVYKGAKSYMPSVVLKTASTEATNYEGYTDAAITTLFNTHGGNLQGGAANSVAAAVNTYDQFTYTVGGQSVTASITLSSGVSATGAAALSAIATAIVDAWNNKYSTTYGTASKTLSFWAGTNHATAGTIGGQALKSANSGSRGYGQTVAFSHSYKASSQMSTLTSGVGTYTFVDWLIGTDDQDLATSDNTASDVDLIITLEETLASGTAVNGSAVTITTTNDGVQLVELTTGKTITGVLSGTLAGDIFEDDAGIYGSISSGGAGDVRDPENADEGLAVTSGSQRAWFTRIHWLG